MPRKSQNKMSGVKIHGFTRLELIDVRGKHKGRVQRPREADEEGFVPNMVTADGLQNYIVNSIGSGLTGKQIGWHQLATQTAAPTSSQTSASGEFGGRKATSNSFVANGTLRATSSWATNEATQSNVGAVAQYNTSTDATGSAASIATFSSSAKTTDQELRITYDWRFTTA